MARRHFDERPDILQNLSNLEIIERYRLDHNGILFLNQELDMLTPQTNRNHSLSSIQQILIALRYLATGSIQLNYADMHGVSQPTVSRVIAKVTDALSNPNFSTRFIRFPTSAVELRDAKQQFYGIARFPNVIGVVDGTHVQLQAPISEEASYVNRMGYHSINTQIAFDAHYRILDVVARWPGATHDRRIIRESGLWALLDQGMAGNNSYILGDSGYPCKRWLVTPYLHPQPGSQTNYNKSHKITRSIVERGIGQLKRRWSILNREIRLQPIKVCKVITACCVLHNICKLRNIPLLDELQIADNNIVQVYKGPRDGFRFRDIIQFQFRSKNGQTGNYLIPD